MSSVIRPQGWFDLVTPPAPDIVVFFPDENWELVALSVGHSASGMAQLVLGDAVEHDLQIAPWEILKVMCPTEVSHGIGVTMVRSIPADFSSWLLDVFEYVLFTLSLTHLLGRCKN